MPRKERQCKLLTIDTETIGLAGAMRRLAIYDGEKVTYGYKFSDVESVFDDLFARGYSPHVYCHNLDFDARKLDGLFRRGNVNWGQTKLISNKYAKIACKHYTLHDSYKILPMSLAKASKDFGLEHGKLCLFSEVEKEYPGQYSDEVDFLARCDLENPLYLKYLGYDVISLYELIQKLCDVAKIPLEDITKVMTTASLSRYIFKNGYGGKQYRHPGEEKTDFEILCSCSCWGSKREIEKSGFSWEQAEKIMRNGYCGGRCEVFTPKAEPKNGEIVARHYDVNSLYPSVMSLQKNIGGVSVGKMFPCGYPEIINKNLLILDRYEIWLKSHIGLGFIACKIFIPEQAIPPLPVKVEKLSFFTGYIQGVFTFTELEYAIKNCGVKIISADVMIYFKNTFSIFENFISDFASIKEQAGKDGNKALRTFAKLMMNVAYGYTALRRDDKTALSDIAKMETFKHPEKIKNTNEELGFFEYKADVYSDYIQVEVGAYVTSYARIVLLDALREQNKKGIVYYCDTDSIVCSAEMDANMVDSTKLGLWDLEGELLEGVFLQPKVYREKLSTNNETIKFKGVSRKVADNFDAEFYSDIFEKLCDGTTNEITVEKKRGTLPSLIVAQKNKKDGNYLNVIDKKMYLENVQKRNISYRDNISMPWHMKSINDFEKFTFSNRKPILEQKPIFGGMKK